MRKLALACALILASAASAFAADGELLATDQASTVPLHRTWKMLDASTGVNDGVWVDWRGYTLGTLHVDGINADTIQVRGSNDLTKPDNSSNGALVGSSITADGFVTITGPYRWLKVMQTVDGSGTITANLTSATNGGGGSSASSGSVTQGTTPWQVDGNGTDNSANTTDALKVHPCVVATSTTAPSYTDTNKAPCTVDTDGAAWVKLRDSGMSVDYYPATGAANQDANSIKASAGVLYGLTCTSIDATPVYLKLYEDDTPTSAGTVKMKFLVPGVSTGDGLHLIFGGDGIAFATAMGSRLTTGFADADTTAVTTDEVICHFYYR